MSPCKTFTYRLSWRRIQRYSSLALSLLLSSLATANPNTVEVAHWWVSDGEKASIRIIERHVRQHGLQWQDMAVAGSGTFRFGEVLTQRVKAEHPPTASQVIGFDIHDWAKRGELSSLNDAAQYGEWAEVIPYGIQALSRVNTTWFAVPINAHSTNWLWVNQTLFDRLGMPAPDTWNDLLELLEAARQQGITPLAIGSQEWEHTLLFENVAAGLAGAEFYRRVFLELDTLAINREVLTAIFQRIEQLRQYMPTQPNTMRWDDATRMVRDAQALLQVQGSWVNGEFTFHNLVPGQDYACFRFPDTQGMFLFNSDHYMVFEHGPGDKSVKDLFVAILMDPALQSELNIATGAAPARVDVSTDGFNACGQRAIHDMRGANLRRTLMGSIAMGNANPAPLKHAIYQVTSNHLKGLITSAQATDELISAIEREHARQRFSDKPSQP